MKTTIEELNDRFLVRLEGELDTVAAVEVNERLQPLYQANGKNVNIDCKDLEYIASSGLRILVSLVKGAKAGGSKVVLHHVNENIKDVFQMTGFTNLFEIED
ncbi:MAG: STAS domain-containing protein [Prevotella sp.]|nr:STAS domain-containing protein [Prevotella sp.]MBQ6188490.1 STAS domain-containing protein [Prevotella sp.]